MAPDRVEPGAAAGRAVVTDVPAASRYVIEVDGERVGLLAYRLADGVMAMTHAEVDPAHGGQGLATVLTRSALADARARGLRVRALCPFVVDYLARHPGEYDDLVA